MTRIERLELFNEFLKKEGWHHFNMGKIYERLIEEIATEKLGNGNVRYIEKLEFALKESNKINESRGLIEKIARFHSFVLEVSKAVQSAQLL